MKKEGRFLSMALALLVLVIAIHSTVHFSAYGASISGFAVDGQETNGQSSSPLVFSGSLVFLVLEWAVLIGGLIYSYTQVRLAMNQEYHELSAIKNKPLSKNATDIDKMYAFLKEKKSLRVATIAKVFEVDQELVENWAKTLETANFAILTYPRIGGPKILLKEKEVDHEEES